MSLESAKYLENNLTKVNKIREDFNILTKNENTKQPLIYLDNAATTQKPNRVINAVVDYYQNYNANVHRGVHFLSQIATNKYEESRQIISSFINAEYSEEVIFTRGTTESVNLVARSLSENYINENDEIIISELDHHSNFVPWQMLCKKKKAKLKFIPVKANGELDLDAYKSLISEKTKLVAVSHVSNTLGTINDIKTIINIAKKVNALVFIDGAQSVPHIKIDVKELNCDFYAFSGHKIYAPMGIGVLYGKKALLENMPPFQFGGEMVDTVSKENTTFNQLPFKFEAGTPNVGGAIGLAEAIKYVTDINLQFINEYENHLQKYISSQLKNIPDLTIIGDTENKVAVFSFVVKNMHPLDIGTLLDKMGICVRTGTHCTQPLLKKLNLESTVRASFCFYNTITEADYFTNSLKKVIKLLA